MDQLILKPGEYTKNFDALADESGLSDDLDLDMGVEGEQLILKPGDYTKDFTGLLPKEEPVIPEPETSDTMFGALAGGTKTTIKNLGTAFDVVTGDDEEIYEDALSGIETTQSQKDFAKTLSEYGDPDGVWDAIKNVGRAAWNEPKGAFHEMIAQTPNMAVVYSGMASGAAIGQTMIPIPFVGAIVGGIAGMYIGNSAIEVGAFGSEQAREGEYDRGEVLGSGMVKAGVITAVDTATMGMATWLTGTVGRASTKAVTDVLIKNGVDIADDVAVAAARQNTEIVREAIKAGKEAAEKATKSLAGRSAIPASFVGETAGEGVGEYLGSKLAPAMDADLTDAVLESMISAPHSVADVAISKGISEFKKAKKPKGELNLNKKIAEDEVLKEKFSEVDPQDAEILSSIESALYDTSNEKITPERIVEIQKDERVAHLAPQLQQMVERFNAEQTETPLEDDHKEILKEGIEENIETIAAELQADIEAETQGQEFTEEEQDIIDEGLPVEEPISVDELDEETTIPVISKKEKIKLVDALLEVENRGTETEQDFADYNTALDAIKGKIGGEEFMSLIDERREAPTKETKEKKLTAAKKSEPKINDLKVEEFTGEAGNRGHTTRIETGLLSPDKIEHLKGESGEVRGEHRNKTGKRWEAFKKDIKENGVKEPILILKDPGKDAAVSEGNHRLDAAIELGLKSIPVEIRYFGKSDKEGLVYDKDKKPKSEVKQTVPEDEDIVPLGEKADRRETEKSVKDDKRSGKERRKDKKTRKKVSEMSEPEMRKALMVDDLTGLNNKRAWKESDQKAIQVSIDADSLKWFNDRIGHVAGDDLLIAIGKALEKTGAWSAHLSGDEFLIQTDTKEEAQAAIKEALAYLENNPLEFVDENNKLIAKAPGTFSFGIADTFKKADKLLLKQKLSRERSGIRARRGEKPPSVEGDVAEQEGVSQEKQDQAIKTFERELEHYKNKKEPTKFDKTAVKNITGWIKDVESNNLEIQDVEDRIESIRDAEEKRIKEKAKNKKAQIDLSKEVYEETAIDSQGSEITYIVNAQEEIESLDQQKETLSRILDCMGK